MELGYLVLLAWLAFAGGAVAAKTYRRSRDDETRRAFAKAPTNIGDVRNGTVVFVAGTLAHKDSISSYLEGQSCAMYEYVEAYQRDSIWHEHLRRKGGVEFSIRDETGEALVHVEDAEVLLNKDTRLAVDNGAWERREGVVANGDRVAVVGHANWEPDPRPESAGLGYRERPTVLVIRGTRRTLVRVTNSPAILARTPKPSSRHQP